MNPAILLWQINPKGSWVDLLNNIKWANKFGCQFSCQLLWQVKVIRLHKNLATNIKLHHTSLFVCILSHISSRAFQLINYILIHLVHLLNSYINRRYSTVFHCWQSIVNRQTGFLSIYHKKWGIASCSSFCTVHSKLSAAQMFTPILLPRPHKTSQHLLHTSMHSFTLAISFRVIRTAHGQLAIQTLQ